MSSSPSIEDLRLTLTLPMALSPDEVAERAIGYIERKRQQVEDLTRKNLDLLKENAELRGRK